MLNVDCSLGFVANFFISTNLKKNSVLMCIRNMKQIKISQAINTLHYNKRYIAYGLLSGHLY